MAEQGIDVRSALTGHVRFEANNQDSIGADPLTSPSRKPGSWVTFKAIMFQDRQRWLVNMRWIAILSVLVVVSVAGSLGWVENTLPLFAATLFMVGYNLLFSYYWKQEGEREKADHPEVGLFLPILSDMAALTFLLHWSGGIENPFALFFVFHMAIGATLLSTRLAFVLGATGSLLWGGTVLLEHWGVLARHPLHLGGASGAHSPFVLSDFQLAGYLTAFILTLFGVVYFVRTAERGRWAAEAKAFQHEQLVFSRDRMARVGEITAGVAHTVRNPIQGVINCVDLLRDANGSDVDSREELIDMMDEGLQRVERVTRRLLALTRERRIAKRPTDLNELIGETLRFLSAKITDKQIALETRFAKLPMVTVDSDSFSEVIMNLVDNAIDACPKEAHVLIETSLVESAPGVVSICVCDSGPGIPTDLLEEVFEPFFTTKAVGEGAGLGLAIVREIVSAHSGRVTVVSDDSHGSCFRILLPIEAEHEIEQGVQIDEQHDLGPCCR